MNYKTGTILLVDDEPPILSITRLVLLDAGHMAYAASDGEEALRILAAHPEIDMIVSDVNMPKKNGIEMGVAIRASGNDIPIAFLTATSFKIREQASAISPIAVLDKPYSVSELLAAITSGLDQAFIKKGHINSPNPAEVKAAFDDLRSQPIKVA